MIDEPIQWVEPGTVHVAQVDPRLKDTIIDIYGFSFIISEISFDEKSSNVRGREEFEGVLSSGDVVNEKSFLRNVFNKLLFWWCLISLELASIEKRLAYEQIVLRIRLETLCFSW